MGIYNGTTKLQQYTQELWNDYTNDEDIVIRKSGNNLNAKPKKAKKLVIQQQPKKKVQQPSSAKPEESKDLKELKDFLEDNLAVGFGSLVPSTNKKRVRNRKQKAKKQTNQPINLQEELNKYDDGWETMLYRNNKRELNKMKRDIEKEEKIQKAQMMNKSFIRHNRATSTTSEAEVKSPVKPKNNKQNIKNTKMIKKQLDQQIELQKQKQQKKNEMDKWNQQKLQNEKKKQQQQQRTRGKDSNFNSIIQEHQQIKEQIKVDNAKSKANRAKPQSQDDEIQKIVQKQVEQEKKQKELETIKAQKEKVKAQKEK